VAGGWLGGGWRVAGGAIREVMGRAGGSSGGSGWEDKDGGE
jgi:hypothetical protein